MAGATLGKLRPRMYRGRQFQVSEAVAEADRYRWFSDDELDDLIEDMRGRVARGLTAQIGPIELTLEGLVIDGRNRELACLIAGFEPLYVNLDLSPSEILARVHSKNDFRRHENPETVRQRRRSYIAELREGGKSIREIAERVGVSKSVVGRELQLSRIGTLDEPPTVIGKDKKPRKSKGYKKAALPTEAELSRLFRNAAVNLRSLCKRLASERDKESIALHDALAASGLIAVTRESGELDVHHSHIEIACPFAETVLNVLNQIKRRISNDLQ